MSFFNESDETNAPFDFLDDLMTKALRRLPWVAVGMVITAVLILGSKYFHH